MNQETPYAPANAQPADAAEVPAPRVPRVLLVLLATYFLLDVITIVASDEWFHLARLAIVGLATWKTLKGSRSASWFLGALFTIGAVASLWFGLTLLTADTLMAIVLLIWAAYTGVTAAYILFSPGMKALYAQSDKTRWNPR